MALADQRLQRTFTLCALYFAQGVPWGFMTIALISFLTSKGVNDARAGELAAIVLVPWTFKLIWAPLIDTMTIRSMGRRRAWIIGAELMMAVTMLAFLFLGDLTQDLRLLGWMFFLHNCFASLQDVSTDALAVDILPHEEQGRVNGLMWGTKLVGKGAGAAGLAYVMAYWGLTAAVMVQFVLLLCIMLLPILLLERRGERRFPWSRGLEQDTSAASSLRNPLHVIGDLLRGFALPATCAFAMFAVLKLVGLGIVEIITKTLYTQQLDWTFVEVSGAYGMAIIFEFTGAVGGGFLADRFGRRKVMAIGYIGYAAAVIGFAASAPLWGDRGFATAFILVTQGLAAVGSVGFLSMGMRIAWTRSAATMFTTYMTLSNVGHVVGNWLAGPVRGAFSYEYSFWLAGVATLLPLGLLLLAQPRRVDELRNAELAAQTS